MAQEAAQNFQNHWRWVPPFHYFALPVLAINIIWSLVAAVRNFSADSAWGVLVATALAVAVVHGRLFALTAQDRVIRLEMRLRMEKLLPADLKPRINDFTPAQLISLRFASDEELPELARKVLNEKLTDRKVIKQMIKNWQPDYLRV